MTIVLPNERPMSWNQLYSGRHWSVRQSEAKRVHANVIFAMAEAGLGPGNIAQAPVDITITAYFDKRPFDADNIASKFLIDGLKGWLIVDDTPKYVHSVRTCSRIDKDAPRVEIEIREAAQ